MADKETMDYFLESSLCCSEETSRTARYYWDNMARGSGQIVIIQQTLAGEGVFEYRGHKHRVPAGHAFLAIVPERSCYYYPPSAKEPWTYCWVNVFGRFAIRLWSRLRARFGPVVPLPLRSPAGLTFSGLIRESEARTSDRTELAVQSYGLYWRLWEQLESARLQGDNPIETAAHYFQNQYHDRISLKELADRLGLSREHFTRLFRTRHGVGPATYLRKRRLAAAREMLAIPGQPLHELASRCGFESVRHFTRAFQREEGLSPQAWRAKLRHNPEHKKAPA